MEEVADVVAAAVGEAHGVGLVAAAVAVHEADTAAAVALGKPQVARPR